MQRRARFPCLAILFQPSRSSLEAVERQIDNDIDVFCTKIVKEEEQSEKHGLAVEKDILRTIEKTKRKLEMAEKERKACEVQENQARKRLCCPFKKTTFADS